MITSKIPSRQSTHVHMSSSMLWSKVRADILLTSHSKYCTSFSIVARQYLVVVQSEPSALVIAKKIQSNTTKIQVWKFQAIKRKPVLSVLESEQQCPLQRVTFWTTFALRDQVFCRRFFGINNIAQINDGDLQLNCHWIALTFTVTSSALMVDWVGRHWHQCYFCSHAAQCMGLTRNTKEAFYPGKKWTTLPLKKENLVFWWLQGFSKMYTTPQAIHKAMCSIRRWKWTVFFSWSSPSFQNLTISTTFCSKLLCKFSVWHKQSCTNLWWKAMFLSEKTQCT